MQQPFISVVSPIYCAENIADKLVFTIEQAVQKITDNFEIILVEDGSPDKSWSVLERIAVQN